MQEYIDLLNNFIVENQVWAGPVIFLLTFGESMLIIGLVIPATAILVATGGLIGAGSLSPWPILIWGIAGAIIGDAVSYYIGRWLGWDITKKPMFANYRPFFVKARLFFKKYGTLSVFLGRFLGPIRSTIPAVAGIMGLDHIRFQIANITSAILWMPSWRATPLRGCVPSGRWPHEPACSGQGRIKPAGPSGSSCYFFRRPGFCNMPGLGARPLCPCSHVGL